MFLSIGTDEIVALTNIVKYLDQGYRAPDGTIIKFDRIVIDTVQDTWLYYLNCDGRVYVYVCMYVPIKQKVYVCMYVCMYTGRCDCDCDCVECLAGSHGTYFADASTAGIFAETDAKV